MDPKAISGSNIYPMTGSQSLNMKKVLLMCLDAEML